MRCVFCALVASSQESYTWSQERQLGPNCGVLIQCSTRRQPGGGGGFAGEGDRQRPERLVARMRRNRYLPSDFPDLVSLVEEADCRLYKRIQRSNTHVLRQYFTENPVPSRLL